LNFAPQSVVVVVDRATPTVMFFGGVCGMKQIIIKEGERERTMLGALEKALPIGRGNMGSIPLGGIVSRLMVNNSIRVDSTSGQRHFAAPPKPKAKPGGAKGGGKPKMTWAKPSVIINKTLPKLIPGFKMSDLEKREEDPLSYNTPEFRHVIKEMFDEVKDAILPPRENVVPSEHRIYYEFPLPPSKR
jgi:hypothetical protein